MHYDENEGYTYLFDRDKNYEGGFTMNFDYIDDYWIENASEEELRVVVNEVEAVLGELDYESDEYTRISNLNVDLVNEISSRFPLNLPHREHGWYLSNDD